MIKVKFKDGSEGLFPSFHAVSVFLLQRREETSAKEEVTKDPNVQTWEEVK